MNRIILLVLIFTGSSCANKYAGEIVRYEYPSSGVTLQNFAPARSEIDFEKFDANQGALNEFLKPYNQEHEQEPATELKDFGPWNFPSDDHISPFEKDLIINFALRIAEQEAPRSSKSRSKMKPVGLVFWKDTSEPTKFGLSVKYREG